MANKKNRDAIWDGCREALDAAASREAQAVAKLQSAARKLGGFTLNEKGNRWVTHCPHCGGKSSCTARTAALTWLVIARSVMPFRALSNGSAMGGSSHEGP
jgi:hypothetical protein